MPSSTSARRLCAIAGMVVLALGSVGIRGQAPDLNYERQRGRDMLHAIKADIHDSYYDPAFHGLDLDARFAQAEAKIREAQSVGQIFGVIGQTLVDFNDSHLVFIPPRRASRVEYGWQMQMIGDTCLVTSVTPGSDAAAKGLKRGDEVLSVGGFAATRQTLWILSYLFYTLRPQPALHVVCRAPGGAPRELDLEAKVTEKQRVLDISQGMGSDDFWQMIREAENEGQLNAHRYIEGKDDVFIWKMPGFNLDAVQVDEMMDKARKHALFILDLRGNGGGAVLTLERLAGHFVTEDTKIADLKGRKAQKPMMAKTRGDRAYKGRLVVLVDSRSASASEIFARFMQLQKRSVVVGDQTAGAVMQARLYDHQTGLGTIALYAVSVTDADVIMGDGQSLEHRGVVPDEPLLPAPADLAAGRDPVMARAAALLGLKLTPEHAGELFPVEWRK